MTDHLASEPELLNLVLRRADLMQAAQSGSVEASTDSENADELLQLTKTLKARLKSAPMAVRRLTLDEPGDLLERLATAEPVHPFATTSPEGHQADLADRFAADRRCFVLEHPLLVGHPLNVVWVALLDCAPTSISQILDPAREVLDPARATTAVFYSIWNVEPGLSGIPGGASLLTGVLDVLSAEFAGLTQMLTLSPIPGFRQWRSLEQTTNDTPEELLRDCARYLCELNDRGRPIDPVARFHLGNGARLIRINLEADLSAQRSEQSFSMMANYSYEPEDRPANQAALRRGEVSVSEQVRQLLAVSDA
ncbi:MAG: hypothetical protein F2694_07555 [Actinobacteria bacterium]|uniref:Unannotated protein n=1 Tax=freshwater metagenome TaxID=449393 RepID=A0A6J6TNA8_9ZZZZ|nr:hypothetical protein [Actinomycetota bacterium]